MAIHTTWHDRVLQITIDRQHRRNAVDHEALDGLLAAQAEADEGGARVVVLGGAGGHFCAGADLTTVEDGEFVALLHRVLEGFRRAPRPVIAGVEGAALGAGTQLAVACDLRTATDDASFGIPAAKLGLMVDQWTIQRLATTVGGATARAMLVGAHVASGADGLRQGWVQRPGGVDAALAWAGELAALAPLTMAGHKLGCNQWEDLQPTSDTYRAAWEAAWSSADLAEGLAAFGERRRPAFDGE